MFAGLPGTGIGGVFYILLTLFMPLRELYLTARGRGSVERWKFVGSRFFLFAGVIAGLWIQMVILHALVSSETSQLMSYAASGGAGVATAGVFGQLGQAGSKLLASGAGMSLLALAIVIGGVYVIRIAMLAKQRLGL